MRGRLLHLIGLAVLLPLPLLAKEPTRLAVVDVGVSAKVPAMFLDLLMVELGKHAELALLERTEVAQLLREQSQSLLMSGPLKADDFVKAGRLWAADAFLMLQANPAKEGQFLRIKLIDTRYGLGLWDTTILLDKDLKNCAPQAEKVARSSSQRAHKLSCSPDDPVLIGVTGFRSEELSSRWAWLAEALTTGMEQHLGLQARMVVLERLKTRPLMEERGLASGLPAALRASSVFVDGSYRINREKGLEVLSVRIRCRRPAAPILELALDGSVNEIAELSSNAAAAIVTALHADTSCEYLDAGTEAQMLAEDAQAYLTRDEPEQAWPRAEADPGVNGVCNTVLTCARRQDDDLLVWGMGGAFRYALGSGQYTSLILDSPCPPLQPRWLKNAPSQLRNLILLGQDIICVDQSRLLWFRNGQDEPVDLLDRLEPRAVMQNLRILDLAVSEQGLLLLTQDTLFLVPDFKMLRPER